MDQGSNPAINPPAFKFSPLDASPELTKLFEALAKAQAEMPAAVLDCKNPHYNSKYASLTSVKEACTAPLAKHGLCVLQPVYSDGGAHFIHTRLGHISGQWISSTVKLMLGKQDMQGLGSAITYAKRYCLSSLVGVVDSEDDDGNAAADAAKKAFNAQVKRQEPKKTLPPSQPKPQLKNHAPQAAPRADDELERFSNVFEPDQETQMMLDALLQLVHKMSLANQMPDIIAEVTGSKKRAKDCTAEELQEIIAFIEKLEYAD